MTALSGCNMFAHERVCSQGHYTVITATSDNQLIGGDCIPNGQEPPAPYFRFPGDLEPTYLSDYAAAKREFQARIDAGEVRIPAGSRVPFE